MSESQRSNQKNAQIYMKLERRKSHRKREDSMEKNRGFFYNSEKIIIMIVLSNVLGFLGLIFLHLLLEGSHIYTSGYL